eukprot:4432385-Amphidinium_carterae.1
MAGAYPPQFLGDAVLKQATRSPMHLQSIAITKGLPIGEAHSSWPSLLGWLVHMLGAPGDKFREEDNTNTVQDTTK